MADRMVRLLVAAAAPLRGFSVERLTAIDATAPATPRRLALRFDGQRWHVEAPEAGGA